MRVHAILVSALLSNVVVAVPVKRDGIFGGFSPPTVSKHDDFLELDRPVRDAETDGILIELILLKVINLRKLRVVFMT